MADPGYRKSLAPVEGGNLATEKRTALDHGNEHSRNPDVEAIQSLSANNCWTIDPFERLADKTKIAAILERRISGSRLATGPFREFAIGKFAPRGEMHHRAGLRPARRAVDSPFLGGSGDQHFTSARCRTAKCQKRAGAAAASARSQADALETNAWHRLFEFYSGWIHFQLVGENCRQAGAHPLTHFGTRDPERNDIVGSDPEVGVWLEENWGSCVRCGGQMKTNRQTRAGEGGCLEKSAPRELHAFLPWRAARWIARRMR